MKRDKYMGIDVHQATSVVVVLDSEGKQVLETIVATDASAVIRLLQSMNGPLHVTFEETTHKPSGCTRSSMPMWPKSLCAIRGGTNFSAKDRKPTSPMLGNWQSC